MLENSRGSASILFMVVVLPFFAILAMIGIEMTQFFGAREEVRRILDSETTQSLTRAYPSEYVTRRIASKLQALKPYIEVLDVRTDLSAQRGEVVVRGTFNGALKHFAGFLLQQESSGIPFAISSTVRKARTLALIVLDRTIEAGEAQCGSKNLSVRTQMVSRLVRDLEASGVQQIVIGVTPGVEGEVDILTSNDLLPRCGDSPRGYAGIESIVGVPQGVPSDSIAVAYRATELLLMINGTGAIEQRAIVMIAPPVKARSESIPTTFSLVESEAARQDVKVTEVGIVVGGVRDENFFEMRSGLESGRAKYLHLSEVEVEGGNPEVALVHHIQGHTFIAR